MFLVDMVFTDIEKITPELTDKHKQYLENEYKSGKLVFGGRKVPRTGGILISQHGSKSELISILDNDPFVCSGLVSYSILEFIPMMASTAFENILHSNND